MHQGGGLIVPIRGTGFFCANANNFVSAGFRVILSVNRFYNLFNLLSSITFADEHSIFPFMPFILTSTVSGSLPLDDIWNSNSESLFRLLFRCGELLNSGSLSPSSGKPVQSGQPFHTSDTLFHMLGRLFGALCELYRSMNRNHSFWG